MLTLFGGVNTTAQGGDTQTFIVMSAVNFTSAAMTENFTVRHALTYGSQSQAFLYHSALIAKRSTQLQPDAGQQQRVSRALHEVCGGDNRC